MSLEYRILGPIEAWADGHRLDIGGARQRRLLGALILAGGRPLSADRLVEVVWVGDPPARARNTLRTYIARARRALEVDGDNPLVTDPNGWQLERPADALDSARFESLVASARAMSADPMAALASIEEALSLWRDDAFVEFRDEDWCAGEAVRLDELRLAAEEERFEAMLGCGLYDDAIGELERFTGRHPLRDRPRAQQMVALYRAGRQVDAVRAFQAYRHYLQAEIGVEASDELRSLEQRIIVRDPFLQQLAPDGRQLRGYQLGPAIGQGAFGRIYRAAQPMLGREVAKRSGASRTRGMRHLPVVNDASTSATQPRGHRGQHRPDVLAVSSTQVHQSDGTPRCTVNRCMQPGRPARPTRPRGRRREVSRKLGSPGVVDALCVPATAVADTAKSRLRVRRSRTA
jgi:DNA-binding SARP family transcriptional activator